LSSTSALSLDALLDRLSRHPRVEGVLLHGSAARGPLGPAGDYDLVLVLDEIPAGIVQVATSVGGRPTDALFVLSAEVLSIAEGTYRHRGGYWRGGLPRWLRDGVVVFDRTGLLERAKAAASRLSEPGPTTQDLESMWFNAYYDLLQVERRFLATDASASLHTRLRLAGGVFRLFTYYFPARGLPWAGMSAAFSHLGAHDPAYLDLVDRCSSADSLGEQVGLYRQLVEMTMGPLGRHWAAGESAIRFAPEIGADEEHIDEAFRVWNSLVGE
jgi:hypothetical protein